MTGLSPRLRGNLWEPWKLVPWMRSIPALAGEPTPGEGLTTAGRVYPRACGGTQNVPVSGGYNHGLSPRLRGNLHIGNGPRAILRSIPALAGEPKLQSICWAHRRVYPRACGGTFEAKGIPPAMAGLSPRLRGNLRPVTTNPFKGRSIPALAGEPSKRKAYRQQWRVYPRACGGTYDQ